MKKEDILVFEKINYILLAVGFAIVVIGYMLMAGGKPETPEIYNPEVFSTRRVTIAPLVIMVGYGLVMFGIFKRPATTEEVAEK